MSTPDDFTGERFLPACTGEIWAEHWHRYLFAAEHVEGRAVLDAACGEGYGAAWLARHASSVTGLDIDAQTIERARAKYTMPGLRFQIGSVTSIPFPDASFDCVVSFETLEHLAEQDTMLSEFRRVLRADGLLIISTPNKVEYSEKRDFHNEFHVRELDESQFHNLLAVGFGAQRWYGQRLLFNSALWPLSESVDAPRAKWVAVNAAGHQLPPPMYFVALAASKESLLPATRRVSLLADPEDAMYREYTQSIGRGKTLEQLVGERDQQLFSHDQRLAHLEALILDREAIVAQRDRQLTELSTRSATMEKLLTEREQLIVERDRQLVEANDLAARCERLISERDAQLVAAGQRALELECLLLERERIIVERDDQLSGANARLKTAESLIAERERLIVQRDSELAMLNSRISIAEGLISERERIIVERDGQLDAVNVRMREAEAVIADSSARAAALEQQLRELHLEAAARTRESARLQLELDRRTGLRGWLSVPFRRLARIFSGATNGQPEDRR